jgi:AcrR family transcriptional regulator
MLASARKASQFIGLRRDDGCFVKKTPRSPPARPVTAPTGAEIYDRAVVARAERKQRTRIRLLEAALQLMSEGRSFTGLGLREITRVAGVVPTAFYRHFKDLDELGLALVEETGATLRRLLREARKAGVPPMHIIRHSVQIYKEFVDEHSLHIMFMAGERWGGSPQIRRAIRYEVQSFATEMAQDLRQLTLLPNLTMPALEMICGLVVNTMLNAATDILDLPPDQPQVEEDLMENFVRQLRVIFLGATHWHEPRRATRAS